MQQHYLPKGAYLKFFQAPHKPGSIYLYQRNKDIVLTSINNVAKERHLYSFTDSEGNLSIELEEKLAQFEAGAIPILEKMGQAEESLEPSGS